MELSYGTLTFTPGADFWRILHEIGRIIRLVPAEVTLIVRETIRQRNRHGHGSDISEDVEDMS
jgi:hypothetical protein